MNEQKRKQQLKQQIDPLVKLSDTLISTRMETARLDQQRSRLERERLRQLHLRRRQSPQRLLELARQISELTDQLQMNRQRIRRLQTYQKQEINALVNENFTYREISVEASEVSAYFVRIP